MNDGLDYILRVVVPDITAYVKRYLKPLIKLKLIDWNSYLAIEKIKYASSLLLLELVDDV